MPELALDWHRAGKGAVLATVVETWGSAPRAVGAQMVGVGRGRDGRLGLGWLRRGGGRRGGDGAWWARVPPGCWSSGCPMTRPLPRGPWPAARRIRVLLEPVGRCVAGGGSGQACGRARRRGGRWPMSPDLEGDARRLDGPEAWAARFPHGPLGGVEEDGRTFVSCPQPALADGDRGRRAYRAGAGADGADRGP